MDPIGSVDGSLCWDEYNFPFLDIVLVLTLVHLEFRTHV